MESKEGRREEGEEREEEEEGEEGDKEEGGEGKKEVVMEEKWVILKRRRRGEQRKGQREEIERTAWCGSGTFTETPLRGGQALTHYDFIFSYYSILLCLPVMPIIYYAFKVNLLFSYYAQKISIETKYLISIALKHVRNRYILIL